MDESRKGDKLRRHPEVLAVFGEPRRTATNAYAAILRDASQDARLLRMTAKKKK
jgi:hypothetical protein